MGEAYDEDVPYVFEIADAMTRLVNANPILGQREGLHRFYWPRLLDAAGTRQNHALQAILTYLHRIGSKMKQPVLHLWGQSGTGKTHLGLGLAAYIIQNHWTAEEEEEEEEFETFAYVDWPVYMRSQLEDKPIAVNWEAKLLVLDDLDAERPIPRSGDPFRLNHLYTALKPRLEQARRPTIILTRHSIQELEPFLATNVRGEIANAEARDWAAHLTLLISARTLVRGCTYGSDIRRETLANPQYLEQVLAPLIAGQNIYQFFSTVNPNGLATRF